MALERASRARPSRAGERANLPLARLALVIGRAARGRMPLARGGSSECASVCPCVRRTRAPWPSPCVCPSARAGRAGGDAALPRGTDADTTEDASRRLRRSLLRALVGLSLSFSFVLSLWLHCSDCRPHCSRRPIPASPNVFIAGAACLGLKFASASNKRVRAARAFKIGQQSERNSFREQRATRSKGGKQQACWPPVERATSPCFPPLPTQAPHSFAVGGKVRARRSFSRRRFSLAFDCEWSFGRASKRGSHKHRLNLSRQATSAGCTSGERHTKRGETAVTLRYTSALHSSSSSSPKTADKQQAGARV